MSGPGFACPNGHPATLAGQRFCEVCGQPVGPVAPTPPPAAGTWGAPPPVAPVPPPVAPVPPPVAPAPGPVAPGGWGPPPAGGTAMPPGSGGRSRGPLVLVALVGLAAVVLVAVVVVLRPFGGPAASPSPVAVATGTIRPTMTPATSPPAPPTPSPVPSAPPTPAPTPSVAIATLPPLESPPPASPAADLVTCRSDLAGIDVSYPAGWSTILDGSPWTCLLFDPAPFEILPDTELPEVAVTIYPETRAARRIVKDFTTADAYEVVSTEEGEVDGYPATAVEVENTGQGYYEAGVLQAVVVVDLGDRGSLVVETIGRTEDEYDARVDALVTILEWLAID